MVQSLPEINLILNISVSAPACIIAQHKDHKMHPRTKVTIQIIKRGIRTIFVQIHLACLLAESQTFYQRGKNIIHLGCISMFHYISSLYYSRVKHASVGEMQSKPPAHGVHCSSQRSEFKDWIFKKCFHRSVGLLSSTFYYKIRTLACIICEKRNIEVK